MRDRCFRKVWIALVAAWPLGLPLAALGDEIRYLAWDGELERAAIETVAGAQWVGLGDIVPGFGAVAELDEDEVLLRRALSEAEREALASQGLIAHWAEEWLVPRYDLRFHGIQVGE